MIFIFPMIASVILIIMGGVFLYLGFRDLKLYFKMNNLATSKIESLAAGEVEIKGKAIPKENIVSPLTNTKCIAYHLRVYEERVEKNKTRWVEVSNESQSTAFYIEDETGRMLVNPENAEIISKNITTRVEGSGGMSNIQRMNNRMNNRFSVPRRSRQLKYVESVIPANSSVYIIGYTTESKDPQEGRLMISYKKGKMYVISNEDENELKKGYKLSMIYHFSLGVFMIFFGIIQVFNIMDWEKFIKGFKK